MDIETVSRSCHFTMSTISRSWEKHQQTCKNKMMNVVGLSLYVINIYGTDMTSTVSLHKTACAENLREKIELNCNG